MADKTWVASEVLTYTDMNSYASHTGGAWNSWSPTVSQGGTVTYTLSEGTYARAGRIITCTCVLTVINAPGSASTAITISLPVTAKSSYIAATSLIGNGKIYDSSAATAYMAFAEIASTTTISLRSLTANGLLGATSFTASLAVSDLIIVNATYEAASG